MEANETSGLSSSYYHHPQQPPPPSKSTGGGGATTASSAASPTNGIMPNQINSANSNSGAGGGAPGQMVYSHAVPSAVSTQLETVVKRKRGRPRKYGTPEQAAAAKRLAASASSPVSPPKKKYYAFAAGGGDGSGASSSKKSQLGTLGSAGQGFTPHVINVNAGEDVGQKVMLFMQQSKREMCVISASGTISNASLRQPAISGGNISYEGRFEILSLTGSYVRTELGGRTGGLSVCLSSSDGQIVGGGVGGPLTAAGPTQVIVGSFMVDGRKDVSGDMRGDTAAGRIPSPVGGATSVSGMSFRSPVNSSHQSLGGGQYMMQHQGMHINPSRSMDWRTNSGHGMQQSPENGDYQHLPD